MFNPENEIIQKINKIFRSYWHCTIASFAIAFAIMAPVMMGSTGMALDLAQSYQMKQRLCGALDNSVIAAASAHVDPANIENEVNLFFDANYPAGAIGTPQQDVSVTVGENDVTVIATAVYQTSFMRVLGIHELSVTCEVTVNRDVRGLEVVMVLDVTGSMSGANMAALRTATENFINILYDRASDPEFVKIGLVPYSATVNVGSIAPELIDYNYPKHPPGVGADVPYVGITDEAQLNTNIEWRGCVMARLESGDPDSGWDYLDIGTDIGGFWEPYWWHDTADPYYLTSVGIDPDDIDKDDVNNWDTNFGGSMNVAMNQENNKRTPNLGCPEFNPIVPLTNDKEALLDAAEDLRPWNRGGTLSNTGMIWGYRVISPSYPFTDGVAFDDIKWQKVIVIMTDGQNAPYDYKTGDDIASDFIAYGYPDEERMGPGINSRNEVRDEADSRFLLTCNAAKTNGVEVYSIVFKANVSTFVNCASGADHYYTAANDDDLIEVFETISKKLSILHLTN